MIAVSRKLKKKLKHWTWRIGRFELTWRGAKRSKIRRSDPIHIGNTILYNFGPFAVFEYQKKR